jgi:thiol:disulfide interchange protein
MHIGGTSKAAVGETRMRKIFFAVMVGVLGLTGASLHAQVETFGSGTTGPVKAKHLTVELIPAPATFKPGADDEIGLHFTMEPGWHIYWSNAGDAGEPPQIAWTMPAGITADAMQFPIPKRIPVEPLANFGYEGEIFFPIKLHVAADAKPGILTANVNWLVCREVCIPGKAVVGMKYGLSAGGGAIDSAISGAHLPQALPAGARVDVSANKTEFLVTLHTGSRVEHAEFFPYDADEISNPAAQQVEPLADGIRIHVPKDDTLTKDPAQLHGLIKLSDTLGYDFTSPVGAPVAAAQSASAGLSAILLAVGLAFLGGIILNLMPCVFPVLFLKALSLVQSSGEERAKLRRHGVVYTLGILVSFWVIVAVLLLLRAGGSHLGWGFQLQSPVFVAIIACLLFFMALSLAGQFDLGLTLTGAGDSLTHKSGYAGSFFTGVLATVVATPCTAPLVGAAIGFALAQSATVTMVIFTSLALGLAAPYVALTLQPSWTRWLPKPGAWMEYMKVIVSIPLFLTAIGLVAIYAQFFSGAAALTAIFKILVAMLGLAAAGWALGRWPAKRGSAIAAAVLVILSVAIPVMPQKKDTSLQWETFTPARLSELRSQGKPVFVDFTAAWCLSCQVNERAVLQSDGVQQRLRTKHVALLRADWTKYDPQITAALADVGRSGVPTYIVYAPGAEANVLPELLTPGIVDKALDALPSK